MKSPYHAEVSRVLAESRDMMSPGGHTVMSPGYFSTTSGGGDASGAPTSASSSFSRSRNMTAAAATVTSPSFISDYGSLGVGGIVGGSSDNSASLRHALGVIDKLQGQLLSLRSERNTLDEKSAMASMEMRRHAETVSDFKRRAHTAEDRVREARGLLDRKTMDMGTRIEDLEDELRACRIAAQEDQGRWKSALKRATHLETQLAVRERRNVELDNLHRSLTEKVQLAEAAYEKRQAKKDERHSNDLSRLQAECNLKVQKAEADCQGYRSELDRLREGTARTQTQLDHLQAQLQAERGRKDEAARLAKHQEAGLRDALNTARVDMARREERLRAAEAARVAATQALEDARTRFERRADEQESSYEQASDSNAALQRELENLREKHEVELRAQERRYKRDIRKLRKIAKRAIVERNEAIAGTSGQPDVLLQQRLVDEVVRLQAENAASPSGTTSIATAVTDAGLSPSSSSFYSSSSPRRRSPRSPSTPGVTTTTTTTSTSRRRSPSTKGLSSSSSSSSSRNSPTRKTGHHRVETALGSLTAVAMNGNEENENDGGRGPFASTMSETPRRPQGLDLPVDLYDDDDLDEDEDGDLLFLSNVARKYSPGGGDSDGLEIPLRRTGGVSWDVDMA